MPYSSRDLTFPRPRQPLAQRPAGKPEQLGAGNFRELVEALPVDDRRERDQLFREMARDGIDLPADDGAAARTIRETRGDRFEQRGGRIEGVDRG